MVCRNQSSSIVSDDFCILESRDSVKVRNFCLFVIHGDLYEVLYSRFMS